MTLVKDYILKQISDKHVSQADAEKMLKELYASNTDRSEESIAIIGLSGRFSNCDNADDFWSKLVNGERCIYDFPSSRVKDVEPTLKKHCYIEFLQGDILDELEDYSEAFTKGGYLKQIDKFDAAFFGIPPREAKYMDPTQRLFLETAYEAIEDAGYGGDGIYGTRTGVFVGRDTTSLPVYRYMTQPDPMHLTGSYEGILASRLSYIFNLQGPAMVLDTACSSAMISIHEACLSIKSGDCDMAVAGGINLFVLGIAKDLKGPMDLSSIESGDNKIRTFDRDAKGTVWGEGVGAVLLKPLSKAIEDGDNIHAIIRGSALNNDGASNGITAPSASAQEDVIIKAWKNARINPETINYIEAHGTGTVLGDPIEIKGLTNAFRRYTDKAQFCGIGSLKPNMGHLVSASGIASLIKVVMALKHKTIPASINFENPNPYINFTESPVYINDSLQKWERGESPRRAAINAFGFSGTNCHLVLEEAGEISSNEAEDRKSAYCLTISARNQLALDQMIIDYKKFINSTQDRNIESICYTSNIGRGHFSHRLVILARNYEELKEKIDKLQSGAIDGLEVEGIFYGEHKVVIESKKNREIGEITAAEKMKYTKEAGSPLDRLSSLEGEEYYFALKDICSLYAKGADIPWKKVYNGRKVRKTRIPTYPFEKVRYWAEAKKSKLKCRIIENQKDHPLVHNLVADSIYQQIYETDFTVGEQWVLSDHKVMGNSLIPGTTYLEMARVIGNKFYNTNKLEFRDVVFLTPLIVGEDEVKNVQVVIKKEEGYLEFVITSRQDIGETETESIWIKHAEGKVYENNETTPNIADVEKLIDKCGDKKVLVDMSETGETFEFGPRWQSLKEVNHGSNEALAKVELDEKLIGDLMEYYLHPALLDNAINATMQDNDGIYLPLNYKSFKLFSSTPSAFYSNIRKKSNDSSSKETITYDITLMDTMGKVIAEITDYTIKRVTEEQIKFKKLSGKTTPYYSIGWVKRDMSSKCELHNKSVLVFMDSTGFGKDIINRLEKDGNHCIEVELGSSFEKINDIKYIVGSTMEDYEKLAVELTSKDVNLILHMLTMDCGLMPQNLEQLEKSQDRGVYSLFYLIKSIINKKVRGQMEIALISNNTCGVVEEQGIVECYNASLMGLGKVIPQEYTNLNCRFIDIDSSIGAEELLQELAISEHPYMVAYRNGERFVEEFYKLDTNKEPIKKIEVVDGSTYIITGGTGGLGLEIAKYLAGRAKVNLALINRSILPDRSQWDRILSEDTDRKLCHKIKSLLLIESQDAKIECFSADVSKLDDMRKVVEDIHKKYGRISGVIHGAGVAGDGYIMRKDEKVFKDVIAPKVFGTWILDELTREDHPDFFVMFSSITTLFGGNGQGDYTAANSFLDSFSSYRNGQGLNTVSINWPAWKEVGMAADYNAADNMLIFKPIKTKKAIKAFEGALDSDYSRVIPGEINYSVISEMEKGGMFSISSQIKSDMQKHQSTSKMQKGTVKVKSDVQNITLKGKSEEEYTEVENKLGRVWGQTLSIPVIDVYDNFYDMGGDSILATHLLKAIEQVYPEVIDISDIFSYPTVVQMAEYIESKINTTGEKANQVEVDKKGEEYKSQTSSTPETSKFELSPVQRCFFSRKFMNMNHWNECFPIYLKDGFDENILKNVINNLMNYHEGLRLVFREENGRYMQYLKGKDEILNNLVISEISPNVDLHDALSKEAIEQNLSINLAEGPLIRFILFKTVEGDYLYTIMHHLIIDGLSMAIVMEDVMTGYVQALKGAEISFCAKTMSIVNWANFINDYALKKEITEEMQYWDKVDNAPIQRLPRDAEITDRRMKNDSHLTVELLDQTNTNKLLREVCRHYKTITETILLASLGMTIKNWGGLDWVHMRLCGNGRDIPIGNFDFSRTIGWLSMSYPFILKAGGNISASEMVENIKRDLAAVPNKGVGYDTLRFITIPEKYPEKTYSVEPEIFFNYLGSYGEPDLGGPSIPVLKAVPEKNLDSEREYVLNFEAYVTDNKLIFTIIYNSMEYKSETMLSFIEELKKSLKSIMKLD